MKRIFVAIGGGAGVLAVVLAIAAMAQNQFIFRQQELSDKQQQEMQATLMAIQQSEYNVIATAAAEQRQLLRELIGMDPNASIPTQTAATALRATAEAYNGEIQTAQAQLTAISATRNSMSDEPNAGRHDRVQSGTPTPNFNATATLAAQSFATELAATLEAIVPDGSTTEKVTTNQTLTPEPKNTPMLQNQDEINSVFATISAAQTIVAEENR